MKNNNINLVCSVLAKIETESEYIDKNNIQNIFFGIKVLQKVSDNSINLGTIFENITTKAINELLIDDLYATQVGGANEHDDIRITIKNQIAVGISVKSYQAELKHGGDYSWSSYPASFPVQQYLDEYIKQEIDLTKYEKKKVIELNPTDSKNVFQKFIELQNIFVSRLRPTNFNDSILLLIKYSTDINYLIFESETYSIFNILADNKVNPEDAVEIAINNGACVHYDISKVNNKIYFVVNNRIVFIINCAPPEARDGKLSVRLTKNQELVAKNSWSKKWQTIKLPTIKSKTKEIPIGKIFPYI